MNILNIFPRKKKAKAVEAPQNLKLTDVEAWQDLFGGAQTFAGVTVTPETAMRSTAVFACVRLIAGTIGTLPLGVFRRTDTGREADAKHPLYSLLHLAPNNMTTAAVFWECEVSHALLSGNGYALIERNRGGDPLGLLPVSPTRVEPEERNGRLAYRITHPEGGQEYFDQDDVLHFPGVGWDGRKGQSPITLAGRQSIGVALAAEEHSARFFSQGATPNVALTFPKALNPEQANLIRTYWANKQAGTSNAHLPAVITEGGSVESLTISSKDSQLLESRQFQVIDIARIFGVPPHMIGETTKSTSWGTGLEQQVMGFVSFTLRPWLTKIEQEINRKLFRKPSHFAEFNVAGLLRGDIKTRYEAYRIAKGGNQDPGFMTINEVRKLENLPPDPEGDTLYKPQTGGTVDQQTEGTL